MMKKIVLLLVFVWLVQSYTSTHAQISISIYASIAPPELPYYEQPPCPFDGYLWTPGYWGYGDDGYYWVPGVWVLPPQIGYLWTPSYWGFYGGMYGWHRGYWGQHIGFYGGVNYGYGYGGSGYYGGRWEGRNFRYNSAVVNVNTTIIHNTYIDRSVIEHNTNIHNRTSYNGGTGGIHVRPTHDERSAMAETHINRTKEQVNHQQFAKQDKSQWSSVNHGRPSTPAMVAVRGSRFNHEDSKPLSNPIIRQPAPQQLPNNSRPVPTDNHALQNQPHPSIQQKPTTVSEKPQIAQRPTNFHTNNPKNISIQHNQPIRPQPSVQQRPQGLSQPQNQPRSFTRPSPPMQNQRPPQRQEPLHQTQAPNREQPRGEGKGRH